MGTYLNKGDFNPLLKRLIKAKKDFEVIHTGSSTTIKYDNKKILYSHFKIHNRFLYLFQEVKKEFLNNIEKNKIDLDFSINSKTILYSYYKTHNKFPEIGEILNFKDCCELDIEKAYYNAAYKLGFISQEFYNKCRELPKTIRLMLLGSIATNKRIEIYKNGEKISSEKKQDENLRAAWFMVCEYVDKCLFEFSEIVHKSFLFYYVDGIFFENYSDYEKDIKEAQFFCELKYGLKFKIEKIDKIEAVRLNEKTCKISVYKTKNKGAETVFFTKNIFTQNK